MTITEIPEGAVLIAGDDRRLLAVCVARAQHHRSYAGKPPSARLDTILSALAGSGHADSSHDDVAETGTTTEFLDVAAAARLLNCSTRTARRLAPKLGGRQVGGRWLIDRLAVEEHLAGSRQQ